MNGGQIDTYGTGVITLRIGRKTYEIAAVKANVPHKILGWDLYKKFSLGLEWAPSVTYTSQITRQKLNH